VASTNSLSKRLNIVTVLLTIGVLTTFLNLYGLKKLEAERLNNDKPIAYSATNQLPDNRPIVWISGKRVWVQWLKALKVYSKISNLTLKAETGYLSHVIDVFERLGFQKTFNGSAGNWDVLWSHEYPFMNNFLPPLKPHQRVSLKMQRSSYFYQTFICFKFQVQSLS